MKSLQIMILKKSDKILLTDALRRQAHLFCSPTKDVLCGQQEPIFDGKNGSTKNQQHFVVSFGEAIPRTRLSLWLRS